MYGKRKKRAKRLNGGDVHFVKITVKITPPPWLALPLIEQKYHFVHVAESRFSPPFLMIARRSRADCLGYV